MPRKNPGVQTVMQLRHDSLSRVGLQQSVAAAVNPNGCPHRREVDSKGGGRGHNHVRLLCEFLCVCIHRKHEREVRLDEGCLWIV